MRDEPEPSGEGSRDPAREHERKIKHDLRTPIGQILGYGELLREEAEERGLALMVSDLDRIALAARRAEALIDALFKDSSAEPVEIRSAPSRDEAPHTVGAAMDDDLGSAHLLVTDDNEANREMLSRRLRAHGFTVEVAADGPDTLARVAGSSFDLLLLDVMMPEMSGTEVLAKLRQTSGQADLPVIMATANDASEDIVEALRLGANDYVTKPLDFPVVLARIKTQLALKKARDEVRKLADELAIRNRFIQETFGRYLSDEVVSTLLENPAGLELGGAKRKVTIMMTDIRGFSSLAEQLPPDHLVKMLNKYLGVMAEMVMKFEGTIDEFIGDAILAIFGAPILRDDDATRAIACAVSMQNAMDEVNRFNAMSGFPSIEMGIALHTGEVVVGNIGSEARAKYGVVGSSVNLTARIESYSLGGQILISEATLKDAGPPLCIAEQIEIAAKGFRDPVRVYDLRGIAGSYGLFLPEREEAFAPLAGRVDAHCSILDGAQSGNTFTAEVTSVSGIGAELTSGVQIESLTELRIRVTLDDGELSDDIYGKVVETPDDANTIRVRFTSVPADIDRLMRLRREERP